MGSIMPASLLAARRCERLVREGSDRCHRLDEAGAEPLLRRALAEAERSGRPRQIARAAQSLYFLLRRQARHAESVQPLERVVDAHRHLEGVDGRWTGEWRNELIGLYGRLGRRRELEATCRERLASEERQPCGRGVDVAWAQLTLAWALRDSGSWAEPEALCREALALIEDLFGEEHPRAGWALTALALVRERQADAAGAEALLRRARAGWERAGHAERAAAVEELLIDLYVRQGRLCEALELSCGWFQGRICATEERRLHRMERHAALLRSAGREPEAADWDARACELRAAALRRLAERERLGAEAPDTPAATCCAPACPTGPIFPSPLL